MSPVEKLLGPADSFFKKVFSFLEKDGIDVSAFELDHVCYRVETFERYLFLKEKIAELGTLLSEAIIGGRPISTYKLKTPLLFEARSIELLELPSPKEGSFYAEGWEHVEFVIDLNFDDFLLKYPLLVFDTGGITKAVNAEIGRKYENCAVKFHHHHLAYVIAYLD